MSHALLGLLGLVTSRGVRSLLLVLLRALSLLRRWVKPRQDHDGLEGGLDSRASAMERDARETCHQC